MTTHKSLFRKLFGPEAEVRDRLYNITFAFGILMGITGAVTCVFIHSSAMASGIAAAMTVLVFCMWVLGYRHPKHRMAIIKIALVCLDFVVLPALYLSGGSIHSGISAYFALGIALSLLCFRGRNGTVFVTFQSLFYLFLYWLSWRFSDRLTSFPALFAGNHWFEHVAVGSIVLMVAVALSVLIKVVFSVLRQESHSVEEAIIDMTRLAETDHLTGLSNRRAMYKAVKSEVSRAKRRGLPLSAILIDIDDFKLVNDEYGHTIGDEVLRELSAILTALCSEHMRAFRFGGEEFVVLLPGYDRELAEDLSEKIRMTVAGRKMSPHLPPDRRVTVSIGVAEYNGGTGEALIDTADHGMYIAKSRGKNQVYGITEEGSHAISPSDRN